MKLTSLFTLGTLALLLPTLTQATTLSREDHPERYTFFLNAKGSHELKKINDEMAELMLDFSVENSQDALKANTLQNQSYQLTGIAPAIPQHNQPSRVRDDGNPVKALTCSLMTLHINQMQGQKIRCKDEVGAEYIGFNGWPSRHLIAKTCQVGELKCPVYLTLRGDSPTQRDDSVEFVAKTSPKPREHKYSDIPTRGCEWVDISIKLGSGKNAQCQSMGKMTFERNKVTAPYTTKTGQSGSLIVTIEKRNSTDMRYVRATPDGKELMQIYKEGRWICNQTGGKCY